MDYPRIIMGEDNFTGWFSKCLPWKSEQERAVTYRASLDAAYVEGVRGFSMSPHQTLLAVLKEFHKEKKDITCISNHHWGSHYYVGSQSLWTPDNRRRLDATEKHLLGDAAQKISYYENIDESLRFASNQLEEIRLDEAEYNTQLESFVDFCDYAIVGNLGRNALFALGREDIIRREIQLVRNAGMVPIGICEGGSRYLDRLEKMDIAGTWVWLNRDVKDCNQEYYGWDKIRAAKKPVTAYRLFYGKKGFDLEESLKLAANFASVNSIVVGVDNAEQAKSTFASLKHRL